MMIDHEFLDGLAEDAVSGRIPSEANTLIFNTEPVTIQAAPEDTVLLVVSDFLTASTTIPSYHGRDCLLKGTILIKVSDKVRKSLLPEDYGQLSKDQGLFYSEASFFKSTSIEEIGAFDYLYDHLGSYDKTLSRGLVIPIKDVEATRTFNFMDVIGKERYAIAENESKEYLKEDYVTKLITPFSDVLTVVVMDKNGKEYRRTYRITANKVDAIRWTLESRDLPYYVKDILKIEVL